MLGSSKKIERRWRIAILVVFPLSIAASLLAKFFGFDDAVIYLGIPALAVSGFTFIGHFVTLDDDMPGEWSNPQGDKRIWHASLLELAVKAAIFAGVVWIVV